MNAKLLLLNGGKMRAFIAAAVVELATSLKLPYLSVKRHSIKSETCSASLVQKQKMGKRAQIKCSPPNQILTMSTSCKGVGLVGALSKCELFISSPASHFHFQSTIHSHHQLITHNKRLVAFTFAPKQSGSCHNNNINIHQRNLCLTPKELEKGVTIRRLRAAYTKDIQNPKNLIAYTRSTTSS